jgi:hypothetical protein
MFVENKKPFIVSLRPEVTCLQLLEDARFDWYDENTELGLLEPELDGPPGAKRVELYLIGFRLKKSNHLVVAEFLAEDGFRSADIRETLVFAGQFPKEQLRRWITTAKPQWSGEWGHRYLPLLRNQDKVRRTFAMWSSGNGIYPDTRILAVKL